MSNKKPVLVANKAAKPSNKEILLSLLCGLMAFPLFIFPLMYIAKRAYDKEQEAINSNPAYTMCIITNKHSRKVSSIDIVCVIDDKKYYYDESVSHNYYRELKIGDEVRLKYCKDDPNFAVVLEGLEY